MTCLQSQEPKITIVIVNWNKKHDVIKLLDSLKHIKHDNHTIVVVDNASTDDSVEAIKSHPMNVILIQNSQNLGGTGGFNTGIQYSISNLNQDYIWLLDNDAEVCFDTLSELIKEMEGDTNIGIAGSRIMSPENKELIVEIGGTVDWKTITWSPNFRYAFEKDYAGPNILQVDYVAACSALVRKELFKKVGFMDERFFIHWDDIDFCLSIRENGYKVVSVFSSKVFHGVEKGFNAPILYYDFRNSLLLISKHRVGLSKYIAIWKSLQIISEALFFFLFDKRNKLAKYNILALYDFLRNKFGKGIRDVSSDTIRLTEISTQEAETELMSAVNILIFQDGAFHDIKKAIDKIITLRSNIQLTLLVEKNRINLYSTLPIDHFIVFDLFKESKIKKALLFLRLILNNYSAGISTNKGYTLPFIYCVKKNIVYDSNNDTFYRSEKNVYQVWKIMLSVLLGNLVAVLLSPLFYLSSFAKNRTNNRTK